jgi:hypothetical protein
MPKIKSIMVVMICIVILNTFISCFLHLGEKDGGHVVSFGTGCSSLFAGKLSTNGRSLIDGHAEAVARRGLLR